MEQLLPHITLPADSQLQVVSPDAFHLVDSLIHHYHLEHYISGADSCWWRYDPGVIALPMQQMAIYMLKAMGYGRMGMSPESKSQVIDLYMGTLADSLHKEYAQLESFEYQKEMLPSLIIDFSEVKIDSTFLSNFRTNIASMGNVAERAKLLVVVLCALDNSCADWDRFLTAYMAQDSRGVVEMAKSNGKAFEQAAEKLATEVYALCRRSLSPYGRSPRSGHPRNTPSGRLYDRSCATLTSSLSAQFLYSKALWIILPATFRIAFMPTRLIIEIFRYFQTKKKAYQNICFDTPSQNTKYTTFSILQLTTI